MTSGGGRCPHCLRELEPEAGLGRRGEAAVAAESDDGDSGCGEAVGKWSAKALVRAALKPPKAAQTRKRRRVR